VAQILIDRGITVVRAADIDLAKEHVVDGVSTDGFQVFSSRDVLFYYHDSVYEAPTPCNSRLFEHEAYYWILKEHRSLGSSWYKSWKTMYEPSKPLWEAANLYRVGLDILF